MEDSRQLKTSVASLDATTSRLQELLMKDTLSRKSLLSSNDFSRVNGGLIQLQVTLHHTAILLDPKVFAEVSKSSNLALALDSCCAMLEKVVSGLEQDLKSANRRRLIQRIRKPKLSLSTSDIDDICVAMEVCGEVIVEIISTLIRT
jgi:hypothetical protein